MKIALVAALLSLTGSASAFRLNRFEASTTRKLASLQAQIDDLNRRIEKLTTQYEAVIAIIREVQTSE